MVPSLVWITDGGNSQYNQQIFKFKTHPVQQLRLSWGWAGATYPRSASKLTSEFRGVWVLLPKSAFF